MAETLPSHLGNEPGAVCSLPRETPVDSIRPIEEEQECP
jgi:hypothetical protein